jgi:arsenite methyltransferase
MNEASQHMRVKRRGNYGFDSPYVPISFAGLAIFSFGVAAVLFAWPVFWLAGLSAALGVLFVSSTLSFVWTTRRGKFIVWTELLDALALRGDERLLDVGCGRGAVLTLAAERLPAGRAIGIDLWSATDQSGNSEQETILNADLEGVRERIELHTGDMRKLPFHDQSFDVVTSSLAIHNISDEAGRQQALAEIRRVLKVGGTALLADFRYTENYQRYLAAQPHTIVERKRLDWRFWYGGPQAATTLITMRRL